MKTKIDDLIGRYVETTQEKGTTMGQAFDGLRRRGRALRQDEIIGLPGPSDFLPGAQTVITYFLPFDGAVVKSNIRGGVLPGLGVLSRD